MSIAKLHHSVVGKYDFIKADRYVYADHGGGSLSLELPESWRLKQIESIFTERSFAGYSFESASTVAISILLFLSMLPLHADRRDHQKALMANGLRLFTMLDHQPQGVTAAALDVSLSSREVMR